MLNIQHQLGKRKVFKAQSRVKIAHIKVVIVNVVTKIKSQKEAFYEQVNQKREIAELIFWRLFNIQNVCKVVLLFRDTFTCSYSLDFHLFK